jgi:hypothetical protein
MSRQPPPVDRELILDFVGQLLVPAPGHDVGCVELRVLDAQMNRGGWLVPGGQFATAYAGYYDRPDALATDAQGLGGVSAYITPNPVDPALRGRSHNVITRAKKENTTADENILCLRWVHVDVDAKRPSGISSTDKERQAALDLKDLILADHPEIAAASIHGSSGNGAWVLVRLPDLPNDAESRGLVEQFLGILSARYNNDAAHVDPATKNPSRLAPLPGTYKCKGTAMPDRPHRPVT